MAAKTYRSAVYDIDFSDAEWELLQPLIYPAYARRGCGRWRDLNSARANLDAIRYVLKTGCRGSCYPKSCVAVLTLRAALGWLSRCARLPPKSIVNDALTKWTQQGLWPRLNEGGAAHQDASYAKIRYAQRRCHQQTKRQRRVASASELRLRRR